jgi:hypothetical protein
MSSIDRESYWSILGDALRTHKRCLRYLFVIDVTLSDNVGRKSCPLGSLQEFGQLDTLCISAHLLIGPDDGNSTLSRKLPRTLESFSIRAETEEPAIPSATSIACLKDVIIPGVSGSAFTWSMPPVPEYARLQLSMALQMLENAGISVFINIYTNSGGIRGITIKTLRKRESKINELSWNPDPDGYVSSDEEDPDGEEADTTFNEHAIMMNGREGPKWHNGWLGCFCF